MGVAQSEQFYWLKVTLDEYELPLIVAETREELATLSGVKAKSITEEISRKTRTGRKCQWQKIYREEYKIYE